MNKYNYILFFFLLSFIPCTAHHLLSLDDKLQDNSNKNFTVEINEDSIFFYYEIYRKSPKILAGKGKLEQLTDGLFRVQHKPLENILFDNFSKELSSRTNKDSIIITLKFPNLSNCSEYKLDFFNLYYCNTYPITDNNCTIKVPSFDTKFLIGIYSPPNCDNRGNSYSPGIIYCPVNIDPESKNCTLTFPEFTEQNLKIFDFNNSYVIMQNNQILWNGLTFTQPESITSNSIKDIESKKRYKKITPKPGYYSLNVNYRDSVSTNDFLCYNSSLVYYNDSLNIYAARDMVIDGYPYEFHHTNNFIGRASMASIGDNYYRISAEPIRNKVFKGLSIKGHSSGTSTLLNDSIRVNLYFPNLKGIYLGDQSSSIRIVLIGENIYTGTVTTQTKSCSLLIPSYEKKLELILVNGNEFRDESHLQNLYAQLFFKYNDSININFDEIDVIVPNLKNELFLNTINIEDEVIQIKSPTIIRWRNKEYKWDKEGTKQYKNFIKNNS